jgi:hypothetical protein
VHRSAGVIDGAIECVAEFIELTDRSRAYLRDAPRMPLLSSDSSITHAIVQAFQLKQQARSALWSPLDDELSGDTRLGDRISNRVGVQLGWRPFVWRPVRKQLRLNEDEREWLDRGFQGRRSHLDDDRGARLLEHASLPSHAQGEVERA